MRIVMTNYKNKHFGDVNESGLILKNRVKCPKNNTEAI
jgi:hypothetical protein